MHKLTCCSFVILIGTALAAAGVTFIPVSATASVIASGSGGEKECIGGTPTGTWPPCTAGSKVNIRRSNETHQVVSSDPLLAGVRTLVFNANFDETGRGHIWGTWRLVLDGGRGEWAGTYSGTVNGWFGTAVADVVGRGTQGQVEGMELRLVSSNDIFPFGLETDTGYRFDPKGGK